MNGFHILVACMPYLFLYQVSTVLCTLAVPVTLSLSLSSFLLMSMLYSTGLAVIFKTKSAHAWNYTMVPAFSTGERPHTERPLDQPTLTPYCAVNTPSLSRPYPSPAGNLMRGESV